MLIRIEYLVPTMSGGTVTHVMFAEDYDEADEICNQCNEYGYTIVDVSNYIEEE